MGGLGSGFFTPAPVVFVSEVGAVKFFTVFVGTGLEMVLGLRELSTCLEEAGLGRGTFGTLEVLGVDATAFVTVLA